VAIQGNAACRMGYAWFNADTGAQIGREGAAWEAQSTDSNSGAQGAAEGVFTPLVDTRVEVRITGLSGVTAIYAGNGNLLGTRAFIQQLGTTAFTASPTAIVPISVAYGATIPLASISTDGTYFVTAGSGTTNDGNVAYGIPALPVGSTLTIFGDTIADVSVNNTVWSTPYSWIFKAGNNYRVISASESATNLRFVPSFTVANVFGNIGSGERLFGRANAWEVLNHGITLLFQLAAPTTYLACLNAYNAASGGTTLSALQVSTNGSNYSAATLTNTMPAGLYTFHANPGFAFLAQISASSTASVAAEYGHYGMLGNTSNVSTSAGANMLNLESPTTAPRLSGH
jgi:hypothetical protein